MNGPIPVPPIDTTTITTALLNVGPGSNPAAYMPNPGAIAAPDATKGNVAGVWGYVGVMLDAPSQTSQPPITCAVYGQGGVVGVKGFPLPGIPIEDKDASGDGVIGFGSKNGVHGIGTSGTGVAGTSTGGSGVAGTSENGFGVRGVSTNGVGVGGKSTASAGVYGENPTKVPKGGGGAGVFGTSSGGDGVHGESQSTKDSGVAGINNSGGFGVWGSSKKNDAVHGESQSRKHAGVSGFNTAKTAKYTGRGSGVPAGVFGSGNPGGYFQGNPAGYFQGDVTVTGNLTAQGEVAVNGTLTAKGNAQVAGNLTVHGDIFLPGADCAEQFDIAGGESVEPGTVVVMDLDGAVRESTEAYDKRVAGVVSGAG